jgi:hypothetical protein
VDSAIVRIRAELREVGQLEVAPTIIDDVNAGVADVTNGVGANQAWRAAWCRWACRAASSRPRPGSR